MQNREGQSSYLLMIILSTTVATWRCNGSCAPTGLLQLRPGLEGALLGAGPSSWRLGASPSCRLSHGVRGFVRFGRMSGRGREQGLPSRPGERGRTGRGEHVLPMYAHVGVVSSVCVDGVMMYDVREGQGRRNSGLKCP